MEQQIQNPLAGYFRQPVIHFSLPSKGQFWPDGALNLPVTGELPILSMTTKDEITIRTPDALLNGAGIVSIIQSCCPSIVDAWNMPSIDVDAVLIAIRVASYGKDMDLESTCPHCQTTHEYSVDLNQVLSNIESPNYNNKIHINDLVISLKPQTYASVNKTNMANFEEQRILDTIRDDSLSDEEKTAKYQVHLQKLVDLNLMVMVDSTEFIQTPTGSKVTNPVFIAEFYKSTDRSVTQTVRTWLEEAAKVASIKPVSVECDECHKNFNLTVVFDYSNFFA